MEESVLVHELRKVISLVNMLRDIGLDKHLSLPKIVVLGNQSSGKSSLVEQIVGLDFLPRGVGVVTRRPLELRMNNTPHLLTPYAEFQEIKEGQIKVKFTDFGEVRRQIEIVTEKVCNNSKNIVDIPIILNIYSSHCPNLTIVDLPGITLIPVKDQPENIYEITKEMATKYIKEPRSIILCVIPANQDLTNSEALHLMREVDPEGSRSIGCLTKIDIMNRGDDAMEMLKNQVVHLNYGYVGVKNRCQFDIDNNVTVQDSLKAEKQFFTTSPIYSRLPSQLFSTESLTKKLATILYQQIKLSIPEILEQIKQKKMRVTEELCKLGPAGLNSQQELVSYAWKSVSKFMNNFTNSINGLKNSCSGADPISSQIREELANLYKQQLEKKATAHLSDKEIQKVMNNYFGGCIIAGYFAVDPFLALIYPLLKQLLLPAAATAARIHSIMDNEAYKIINETMLHNFPIFNSKYGDLVKKVLEEHRKQLQAYLNVLLEAELGYLYTSNTSCFTDDQLIDRQKQKKAKDPNVFQLRKRVDSYFKLVVRNLRDLIPKQIISFLLIKCQKQLGFQSQRFAHDLPQLQQWLKEPSQIQAKRLTCLQALRVLEDSEKRIRMDPDISKSAGIPISQAKLREKHYNTEKISNKIQQAKHAQKAHQKLSSLRSSPSHKTKIRQPFLNHPLQHRVKDNSFFGDSRTVSIDGKQSFPQNQKNILVPGQEKDKQDFKTNLPRIFNAETFKDLFGVNPRPKQKKS